jgi:hypothetical protein
MLLEALAIAFPGDYDPLVASGIKMSFFRIAQRTERAAPLEAKCGSSVRQACGASRAVAWRGKVFLQPA